MGVSKSLTFALQALLARHEAYMADAERDRRELTTRIEQLEMGNKELEATNAKIIEENRNLLDQLEALNSTVNDSEGHIKSLEATLLSSQQTIRRLESDTARAEALERQVILLEQEQADLQNNLSISREDSRSAMFRWKRAEREINDLQEQLERIEQEATTEREHHEEMMGRIERQREMERELNTAAVRLKGAAAVKSLNYAKNGSNVVSYFVRDLLQDNANLQHGITELREMLLNSHDEIQTLRDQMAYHQPLGDGETSTGSTLRAELESGDPPIDASPRVSQEFHVHHHYHVAKPETKKPRKKRLGPSSGAFEPSAGSYPTTPSSFPARPGIAHSQKDSHWSMLSDQPSDFAPSSVPSSPRSNYRSSSLFDNVQSSFPGSPTTSVDPMSPSWRASHRKQSSNVSTRSFQTPTHFSIAAPLTQTHPIIEEADDADRLPELTTTTDESAADDETSSRDLEKPNDDVSLLLTDTDDDISRPPRLRRRMSQESVISLAGGLDIHTLKSRPSQLTLRPYSSTASVVGSSTVMARPMISRDPAKRSSAVLRDNYASYATSPASSTRSISNPTAHFGTSLGKLVGWRPWSGSRSDVEDTAGRTTTNGIAKDAAHKQLSRPPGINQEGAIPGFAEYIAASQKKLPAPKILPDAVDQEALREGLGEFNSRG